MSDVPAATQAAAARVQLSRYAWLIAGPRDAAINAVINGTIAWWLYGARDSIPLTGAGSAFSMLLPMCAIAATATTFFGLLSGRAKRISLQQPTTGLTIAWLLGSLAWSTVTGQLALLAAAVINWLLHAMMPHVEFGPTATIGLIASIAAGLANVCHGRGVIRGGSGC